MQPLLSLRLLFLSTASTAVLLSTPGEAAAGCPGDQVEVAANATQPVNGDLLVFWGRGCTFDSLDDWVRATLDGEPVAIRLEESLRTWRDTVPVSLDPRPIVGQTLQVDWGPGRNRSSTFVIAEADTVAPTAPAVEVSARYDFSDLWAEDSAWQFVLEVDVAKLAKDDSAVRYEMVIEADGVEVDRTAVIGGTPDSDPEYQNTFAPDPDANPFDGADLICARARSIDAAGNASAFVTECIGGLPFEPDPETVEPPVAVPAGDDGDHDQEPGVASCSVNTSHPPVLLLSLLLICLRRRD